MTWGRIFRSMSFLSASERRICCASQLQDRVDDGKSTLIGRLLYDTQSVYDDQVRLDSTARERLRRAA